MDDRILVSGYCEYFSSNLISWSSKKQHIVTRSSTEAEYRVLAHITTKICWLHILPKKLQFNISCSIIWSDNIGASTFAANPTIRAHVKHIEIDLHCVRDMVIHKTLEVRYISTLEQVADIFTKSLGASWFVYLKIKFHVKEYIA